MRFSKNLTIGQYIHKDSIIHKLDPRVKLITVLILIIIIFLTNNWIGFFVIGMYLFSAIIISKINPKYVLLGVKPLLFIIIITLLLHLFTTKGEIIYTFWVLKITKEGIFKGLFIATRLFLLILSTSWLTLTTSPISLTDGIERILLVFKKIKIPVPAHEIAMMMTIALRFIPTLMEETEKIIKAQIARGADFETGNIVNRLKSMIPIIIPLFINAFHRADELAVAMEARCYKGGDGRTHYRKLSIKIYDNIFLFVTFIVFILVAILKYY